MNNNKAWEAFYKTGKIDDYISFKKNTTIRAENSLSAGKGENIADARNNGRTDSATEPVG